MPDLITIGTALDKLSQLRSKADYELTSPRFKTDHEAQASVPEAENALDLLDAFDGDPAKRAAAIAEIRSRWP
jgi:hypothetical protein